MMKLIILVAATITLILCVVGIGTTAIVKLIKKSLRPAGYISLIVFGIVGAISLTIIGLPESPIIDPIRYSAEHVFGGIVVMCNVATDVGLKVVRILLYIALFASFVISFFIGIGSLRK